MADIVHNAWEKVPKGPLASGALGFGLDVVTGMATGQNIGGALGSAALAAVFPKLYWAYSLGSMAAMAVPAVMQATDTLNARARSYASPVTNWSYVDTQAAYTMRSAAVQAIQASKLNARSALGGEARLMARNEAYNTI